MMLSLTHVLININKSTINDNKLKIIIIPKQGSLPCSVGILCFFFLGCFIDEELIPLILFVWLRGV